MLKDLRRIEACVVLKRGELVCRRGIVQRLACRCRFPGRFRVITQRGAQIVKVGPQGEAKHQRIAALVAEVEIGPVGNAIDCPHVDMARLLNGAGKIIGIIVAVILELQAQGLPGRLILEAAKQRRRTTKHIAKADIPGIM